MQRLPWWVLLTLIAALPSLTWLEHVSFSALGYDLHGRFLLWSAAALILVALALLTGRGAALLRMPVFVVSMVWLLWLMVTVAIAAQPLREWLPTVLRWGLYVAATMVAYAYATPRWSTSLLKQYLAAIAVGVAVPLAVGIIQVATGNAPMLNNAPRMTATMIGHPVALSLVIGSGLLLLIPLWAAMTGWHRWAVLGLIGLLFVGIMLTFTRATMLVTPVAAVVVVALAQPSLRRWRPIAVSAVLAALALGASFPFVAARVGDAPPMPIRAPDVAPGSTPIALPQPIDNSTGLRIETHLHGFRYISDSPVVGHGPGSFDRLFREDTGDERVAAHNDLLQTTVETGIVGIAVLATLFLVIGISLIRVLRRSVGLLRWTTAGIGVAFVAVNVVGTIHNPFYFPEVQLPLWVGVGLVLASRGDDVRT